MNITTKQANELYAAITGRLYSKDHNVVQKLTSHGYTVLKGENGRSIIREQDVIALASEPNYGPGHNRKSQITISSKSGKFTKVDYGRCRNVVIEKWNELGIKNASQLFDTLLGELPQ